MRNRWRDARHPLVLGVFSCAAALSGAQLWAQFTHGTVGSKVLREMPDWSSLLFSVLLLASATACFTSAWIRREPRGAKLELVGMIGSAAALGYYSLDIPRAVVTGSWTSTMSVIFIGAGIGCLVRAGLVLNMIRHPETW